LHLARLVIDSGAENSFIRRQAVQEANLVEEDSRLERLHGIGGRVTKEKTSNCVCMIKSIFDDIDFVLHCRIRVVNVICGE
jgi:hypothetical protein